ncbi:hypothetical protein G9A89_005105 [Geosiphon pyriformis]|nr:hypothetical protein G9A89_005105 [Geosiphon pyriformis]
MYADLGDPIAQYYVGYYLITGNHSVLRDTKKAVEYFRRSAEKGIPGAQLRYSVALLKGDGIEKNEANDRIAIENLKKAAISGNPHAMFNYGDILINGGHGVWENIEEGEIWMRAAHDKGHPHALKKLTDRLNSLNKYPSM